MHIMSSLTTGFLDKNIYSGYSIESLSGNQILCPCFNPAIHVTKTADVCLEPQLAQRIHIVKFNSITFVFKWDLPFLRG